MDIIIQLIGFLGIIASIIAFQFKKHKTILFFRMLSELIFAVQYFLLGAYTGMITDLLGCIRNIVFTKQIDTNKKTTVSTVIFSLLFLIFGLMFWEGPKSILVIIAKVLSTIAYGNTNTAVIRSVIFVTSTSWLIYNYFVFSIAGILCEVFTLLSLIIGIIRIDIMPRMKKRQRS